MALILQAAQQLPPSRTNPLRAETIELGLLLLYCCGLRRGELLRLKLSDIDRNQCLLSIVETKFHKSRLVPLDPTVVRYLEHYLQQRGRRKLPMTPDSFLLWSGRHSPEVYAANSLLSLWWRLCVTVKVLDAHGHPPRLHDLRHGFACNALQRWYTQGVDVQTKLPHLATYLGHVSAVSTYYYLQLTPELRQSASQRFHQHFGSLITAMKVLYETTQNFHPGRHLAWLLHRLPAPPARPEPPTRFTATGIVSNCCCSLLPGKRAIPAKSSIRGYYGGARDNVPPVS